PGLLTTVAVTSSSRCSWRIFCTMRAVRSMPPPGPTPTTISTFLAGFQATDCASAAREATTAQKIVMKTRMIIRDSTMGTELTSGLSLGLESTGISLRLTEEPAMAAKRMSIMGTKHVISAGHYLAAHAGFEVLEAGGNAIDAGVAAGIAIGVLQTDKVNFAGVAPQIIYTAKNK